MQQGKDDKKAEILFNHLGTINQRWEAQKKEDESAALTDPEAAAHVKEDQRMIDENNKILENYMKTGKVGRNGRHTSSHLVRGQGHSNAGRDRIQAKATCRNRRQTYLMAYYENFFNAGG